MGKLLQDIRYGVRILIKHPGFTSVAIVTLALGIGANAAIFSVVNSVLLRPLAVAQPEQLAGVGDYTSFPNYRDLVEEVSTFSALAAHSPGQFNLGQGDVMGRVFGEFVTGNYFHVLGGQAALGRTFGTETDGAPGAHPVAVVSNGLWRRRFGADTGIIGRTIILNGHKLTVIGVMPEGFHGTWPFGLAPEVWMPLTMQSQLLPGTDRFADRAMQWMQVFGRLKPGFNRGQAQAEVNGVSKRLAESYPRENGGLERIDVYPLGEVRGASFTQVIPVFMSLLTVIVGLVLLIACANVANLLLSRAVLRQQEVAIRLALGAGRWRLIRQLLTESVLLALAGGAAGCLLAVWMTRLLNSFHPPTPFPIEFNATLDGRVLGFTLALSIFSGVLFGLAPVWHSFKLNLVPLLKDEGRIVTRGMKRFSLRNLLVVSQIVVSLVLLICAGLFTRSLLYSHNVDPGFETERMLTVSLDLEPAGYNEARGSVFYQQLLNQVEQAPGVQSATMAEIIPLTLTRAHGWVAVDGQENPGGNYPEIDNNVVGPRYFETMGIPVIAGRAFNSQDREGAPLVIVINETMARRFWPNQNPIGRRLRNVSFRDNSLGPYLEVVGLVKDSKYRTLGEDPTPFIYLPAMQHYRQQMTLHVRAAGEPDQLRSAVRESVLALDKGLLVEVATMHENMALGFLPSRIAAGLLGLFGLVGMSLAVVGIYGVISTTVSQRTSEIGLRMALGARKLDIYRMVIGQGLKLTLIGIGVGIIIALALTRFLASLLAGVSATDPLTFLAVTLSLIFVALIACWIPARRATNVDPMIALRYE